MKPTTYYSHPIAQLTHLPSCFWNSRVLQLQSKKQVQDKKNSHKTKHLLAYCSQFCPCQWQSFCSTSDYRIWKLKALKNKRPSGKNFKNTYFYNKSAYWNIANWNKLMQQWNFIFMEKISLKFWQESEHFTFAFFWLSFQTLGLDSFSLAIFAQNGKAGN